MKPRSLLVTLLLSTWATEAEATRTILYQTGEEIFDAGPLPEPYRSHPRATGLRAGFKCKVVGLFWAYLRIWGCEPVAYRGHTYDSHVELAGAILKDYPSVGSMRVTFWQRHGRWVLGGVVLLLAGGALLQRKRRG